MHVAIVRWIALGKREMQNYELLLSNSNWQFLGIGSHRPDHDLNALNFPVVKPISLDYLVLKVPGLRAIIKKLSKFEIENLNYMFGLEQHLESMDIVDLAETYHPFCYQVAKAKKALGFRLVVSVQENIPFSHENVWIRRQAKQAVFREADYFLTLSEMAKKALVIEGVPENRIAVVPVMGVDSERFKPGEKDTTWLNRLNLSTDDQVILSVGRLTWSKGILDLIYAFKMLTIDPELKNLPLKLLIVGDGDQKSNVINLIKRLELQEQIRLVERVPYPDMPKIHNLADIFVLPSISTPKWQEQFGAVLAESMACAKPVIGTSSGAIPEVLGDAGLVAQANDFTSLANSLKALLTNKKLRAELSTRARQRVMDVYDAEHIAKKIQQAYDHVMEQPQ